ncbi:MAG: DUF4810 domain-containing protein [Mediterranea sp.]|jgi:hypothetical protein|nr:DUF4810 domain-containing protein [Mediterranea sp.]
MRRLLIVAVAALTLASCGSSNALYSWYGYEKATYRYSKRQTDELQAALLQQYQKLISKQKNLRKVAPPGMYAEFGYLLYKTGKKGEGLNYLRQEIALYPESETYISRIIKQLEK